MLKGVLKAVLFDMDGVLVDTYEAWFHLLRAAADELGGPGVSREGFARSWGQGIEADVATFFPGQTCASLSAFYVERFADHANHVRVLPDAQATLTELRRRGLVTAVITNTPRALARRILGGAALAPAQIVGADDVPRPKPAPDIVLHACALLSVDVNEAVVVGDSVFDKQAARAAGVRFAGFGIDGDITLARLSDLLLLPELAAP